MPYLLPTPVRMTAEHYAFSESFLTSEECDKIIQMGENKWQTAVTVGGDTEHKRRAQLVWLKWDADGGWLWDKLSDAIMDFNNKFFGFDLTALAEDLQLTKYESTNQGHYDWHVDVGSGSLSIRKLSVVIQLTDPAEYEGGELEIFMAQQEGHKIPPKTRGSITVFPSFGAHRVTPVTAGIRHSLVGWVSGPPYR